MDSRRLAHSGGGQRLAAGGWRHRCSNPFGTINVGANVDLVVSAAINGRNGMSHDNVFAEFDDPRQTDTVERATVPAAP